MYGYRIENISPAYLSSIFAICSAFTSIPNDLYDFSSPSSTVIYYSYSPSRESRWSKLATPNPTIANTVAACC
jgi:hypothetical protein